MIPDHLAPLADPPDVGCKRGVQPEGMNEVSSTDPSDRWVVEMLKHSREPVRTWDRVIVRKGDDVAASSMASCCHGGKYPWLTYFDLAQARDQELRQNRSRGLIVISPDDDDLRWNVGLQPEPIKTLPQLFRTTVGRHDYGDGH
jgi:hypothetical protein